MTATTPNQPNAYLKTQVLTASPAELRLMLFDGAIRFSEQARVAIGDDDFETMFNAITRAQAIVMELITSLDPEHDPALCEKLTSLYTFIYTQMVQASAERDVDRLNEAIKLLRFERETWQMLIDKLAGERTPEVEQENRAAAEQIGSAVSVRG